MANPNNEQELLAELDKLEKSTLNKGGDALQNAPHDGGFATQGTNIQAAAKAKKKVLKALVKSGKTQEEAEALLKAMSDSDDDSESDDETQKAFGDDDDGSADDESGDDDESSDDESDDEPKLPPKGKLNKSQGAAQLANASSRASRKGGEIRKALTDDDDTANAVDAVPILDKLIATLDNNGTVQKSELVSLRKAFGEVARSQSDFNSKTARALSILCGAVNETRTLVKSIADQPAQRTPQLRKSDIRQPEFLGNNGTDFTQTSASPLQEMVSTNGGLLKVQETLVDMCMKSEVPSLTILDVTKFENAHGDFSVLPIEAVKRLEQRLFPASA